MQKGRSPQSIGLSIILIALAIQGITPDADDLASLSLLPMLCPGSIDPGSSAFRESSIAGRILGDEVAPLIHRHAPPADEDTLPHEVCLASRSCAMAFRLHRVGGSPRLGASAADRGARVIPPNLVLSPLLQGTVIPNGDLIHSLCRLTC